MTEAIELENVSKTNKQVALLIAVLALLLALSDLSGGNADNDAVEMNVQSANLWAFYQAKTIRRTSTLLAVEEMETRLTEASPPTRQLLEQRIVEWRKAADRYETEPDTGEGRRELMIKAQQTAKGRDVQKAKGDAFDIATALLQVAIVLASAAIITGAITLAFMGVGLGAVALCIMGAAAFAPNVIMQLLN